MIEPVWTLAMATLAAVIGFGSSFGSKPVSARAK
jgi:hypothetical protein